MYRSMPLRLHRGDIYRRASDAFVVGIHGDVEIQESSSEVRLRNWATNRVGYTMTAKERPAASAVSQPVKRHVRIAPYRERNGIPLDQE